jgi:ABC-2 type transport system ATP-binding protein
VRVAADNEGAVRLLEAVPGVQAVGQSDDCIEVLYAGPQDEQHALLTALVQNGYRVLSFAEQESDLEQVFLRVTKGDVS